MFVCTYSLFWYMTIQAPDPHLAVNHHWGSYSIFLRTNFLSKSYALSFTSLGRINMQLQNHLLHLLLDVLMTSHISSRTENQNSPPLEFWQPISQKCSYLGLMSLEYFSISPSGQEEQIIPDVVMSWVCYIHI